MTVTYGFYNSLAGDRKYNAIQLSSLFDGIISDGIFEDYGAALEVTPNSGMDINVGIGRAWFNHTWTLNDDILVLTVDDAETVLNRIDTVILEVDTTVEVRANTIKIVKGTPASSPVAPTLTNAGGLYQYPLFDIYVTHGTTEIVLGDLTKRIGIDTPYVIGVIETSGLAALQDEIDAIMAISYEYKIVPSIASNNLTVALKRIDGSDPSSTNKIVFRVGDTEYDLTAAMSYTKAAGTNWHNMGSTEIASRDVDLFLFAIGETGAAAGLKFGHSRIPFANKMGDFVNTTTNEKYISGNWTNFNSTDPVKLIGRFKARLSGGAGYTWSIPTPLVINHPIFETDPLLYTPVWSSNATQPAIGNGVLTGSYKISYNRIEGSININMGSTTTYGTGSWRWSIPMGITAFIQQACMCFDSGTALRIGVVYTNIAANTIACVSDNAASDWNPSSPMTWANGDYAKIPFVGLI